MDESVAICQDTTEAGVDTTRPASGLPAPGFEPSELPADPKTSNSKDPVML